MAFPSNEQFQPILLGQQPISDVVGDESPSSTDIVGNSQFPAAFVSYDGANIYFRIRVNTDPRNSQRTGFNNFAWGVLINTSGTPGVYDWLAGVNGLNSTVNLIQNTQRVFNSWNDPAEGTDGRGAPNFTQPIANYDVARATLTNDGSNFGGNPDFFVDFQYPAAQFFQTLGINSSTNLQFVIFTSANANNYNKDSLRASEGFQFVNALTDPVSADDVDIRAQLSATKVISSGPTAVLTGNLTTWTQTVTINNTGRSLARQVNVTDVFNVDLLSNVSNISVSTGSATFNSSNRTLSWNIGNVSAGQTATLSYTVTGTFTSSGTQRLNTVTASGIDNQTGTQLANAIAFNDITVSAASAITGQATSGQTGLPLSGVTVELRNINNILLGTTTTNAQGNYSFSQLSAGSYNLTFIAAGFTNLIQSAVVAAGQTQIVNVILQPIPGTVTGTVTTLGGAPISGATVRLVDQFNAVIATVTTNTQGQYSIPNVTPGQYTITASAPNVQSQTRGVTINAGQTTTADFTLAPSPGIVTGTVSNQAGTPISGAVVEVLDTGNNVIATTTTGSQGQYTLSQLAPGSFQLRVTAQNFQTGFLGFTVQAGQTTTQNVVLQPSPGTLAGTVRDAETNANLAGASVNIVNQGGITVATATTDGQGQYTVTNLSPGSYTVTFGQPGYASQTAGAIVQPNATTILNGSLNRNVGVISGTVTNNQGGPLVGAIINVFLNNNVVASVSTNENGAYIIPNLSPGTYSISATAENFQSQLQGAQVVAFSTTNVTFTLIPDPGTLTGTVTDTEGGTIAGAVVNIRTSIGGAVIASGLTNQDGVFTISNLPSGTYIVTASAANYQTVSQGTAIQPNQTTTLDFTLAFNPVSIIGTVTNQQTGAPISGAQIQVRVLDANGVIVSTVFTDLQGDFLAPQLAPGTYTIVAAAPNFQTNLSSVTVPPGGQGTANIALLPNPGFITGQVTSNGDPISGASVSVIDQSNVQIQFGITDSQGNYTVEGLPPGNYNVVVNAPNFQTSIAGAVVLAGATTITNASLVPNPGSIEGTISPNQPNTLVQLYNVQNIFIQSTVANSDGFYQFLNLAPGSYVVTATAPNFTTESTGANVGSDAATTVNLTINPNPSTISGTVLDVKRNPITNAIIRVLDANETVLGTAGTSTNGTYSIGNLPPGSFTVTATAPTFATSVSGVTLQPGSTVTNVDFALAPNPGALSGLVTNEGNGTPLVNATVIIRQVIGSGVAVATVTTDQNGNFFVHGLAPGSYTVTVSFPTFGTETVGAVVISDTTTTANIALNELDGSIEGQLADSNGNSITGPNLQVRLLDLNGVLIQTIIAQPDGAFLIGNVAPGSYVINAVAPGFQASTISVQVQADQVTLITLTLQSSPSAVTGQVLNEQTGIGVAGSVVSIINPNTGLLIASGISSQDGSFLIENLPSGSYIVTADALNFGPVSRAVILLAGESTTTTLPLTPNPGSVQGFVVNLDNGDALSGASIQIFDQTGAALISVASNVLGQYIVPSLAPGNYTAIATLQGFTSQTVGFSITSNAQTVASFALEPNPSQIQGSVTNITTGGPVIGASVIVRQFTSSGPIIATTFTNSNGFYVVPNLPQGTFTVIVLDPIFGSEASSVTVGPGETATLNFDLRQLPSSVEGTVLSADTGEPIVNTLVQLIDENGILVTQTQTDVNGFYQISGFTAGEYTIPFTNPTFQIQTLSFSSQPNQTSVVNVNLIANPGSISGQVFDAETSTPIVGAAVLVYPASGLNPVGTLVTDAFGGYFLSGLAPGPYILVASYVNYATSSTGVTVRSNETTTSDIFLIPNPAAISGTISSDTGQPILGATVRVLDQNETVLGTTVTDQFGNYSLTNLPQGNQQIIVSAAGFATQLGGVILTPGQVTTNVNFTLTANFGSIAGQITASDTGEPIVGAIAVVRTVAGIPVIVASTTTDQLGNYVVNGLLPGSYTITGSATGFAVETIGALVQSDEITEANIALPRLVGSISGAVFDIQGNPLINTSIQIRVFEQSGLLIQTLLAQSDGTFLINNLPPGSYQLTVLAPNYAANTVGAIVVAEEVSFINIPLTPNPATVTGQVISTATGAAIGGAIVSVTDLNGVPIGNTISDNNGNFLISGLPPTTISISAVAIDFGSDSRSVILAPGGTATTTLSLAPNPGSINGFITNEQTGNNLAGATIQVFDFTNALVATVVSDSNGFYQFANIAPGFYRVIATDINFGTELLDVQVLSNQVTTVDFSLQRDPGSIFGTVLNQQTGDFIVGATVVIHQFSPSGPIVQTTATDSSGQFTVLSLAPGTYAVTIFNPNFGTQSTTTTVQSNAITTVSLALSPNPGSIQGQVISAQTGQPIVNTQVQVLSNEGILIATVQTDIDGNFLVPGLLPGTYTVMFTNPEFQSSSVGAVVGAGSTVTVNSSLTPDPGSISGLVLDAQTGLPLIGAVVQVFPAQSLLPIAITVSNNNGNYTILGVEPGEYIIVGTAPNYASSAVGVTVLSNAAAEANVSLVPNPATVSGTITTIDGVPVAGATVRIVDQNETVIGTGVTDQNGNYTVGNLQPGSPTVIISAPGFGTQIIGVTLNPEQVITNLNAQLTPNPGSVRGTITNELTGEVIIGAEIIIRRVGATSVIVASTTSDGNGGFIVNNLSPGTYVVTASRTGFGINSVGIAIISDTTSIANLVLTPLTGSITGTIIDPEGNPITGNNLQIQVFNQSGQLIKSLLASEDGTYSILDLSPGTYQLTFTAPNFATATFSAGVLSEETTNITAILQPNPATLITQVINKETGQPISGAIVTVTLPTGTIVGDGVTNEYGFVTIENLPPHTLHVSISASNFGSLSQSIILAPGQVSETSIFLSPETGSLQGAVVNEITGTPIAGATVRVFSFTRGLVSTVVTDSFGFYEVQDLSTGQYRTIVTADNFGSIVGEASVVVNQNTILNFFLPPDPGAIQGVVINEQTGEPLAGASIVIRQFSPTGPIVATLSTNQNGSFTVNNLAPGSYTVVSLAPNFGSEAASVFVQSNDITNVTLALEPNPGTVQGTVINAQTGAPLSNAFVRVLDSNRVIIQEVQTDQNGRYQVDELAPGDYLLIAVTANFQRETIGFSVVSNEITTVNLSLNPDPGVIIGRIFDQESGVSLEGAVVQVFPAQSLVPIANAVTNQNGNFVILGLAPGEYIVTANARNYARGAVGATVFADQTAVADVGLTPDPSTISGVVTSSGGQPIGNASVRVIDQNEVVLGTALTDQNGNYVISNLPAGSHTVIVAAASFSTLISGVTLTPGGVIDNVNFVLNANPGNLSGQITDSQTSQPIPSAIAVVRLVGGAGVIVANTVTDSDGRYFISGLAPGSYTIVASQSGYGTTTIGAMILSDTTTIANITLAPNAGAIAGVITDLQGSTVIGGNTQVQVFDQSGTLLKTLLASFEGTYNVVDLLPGSYTLVITAPNFAATTTSAVVVSDQTTQANVSLTPQPATLTGEVLNIGTGAPISGAIITVSNLNGIVVGSGTSDINGNFTIPNLPPTTLIVSAVSAGFGSDSKAVFLSPGEVETTILNLTPTPGTLRGMVNNEETGTAIAGATVQVFDFTRALVATVQTDQNGMYELQNLAPGIYRVTTTAANFGSVSLDTQVLADTITTLEFNLQPNPGTITGTVYNQQTGAPVVGASIAIRQFSPVGPIVATSITNSQGQFTIFNLTPSAYTVVASQPNFGTQATSTIVVSSEISNVQLNLPPNPGTVTGVVTSAQTGAGLPNTLLRILDVNGIIVATSQTNLNGSYQIGGLAPGNYTLLAINQEFQRIPVGLTVDSNQIVTLNVELEPNPGAISGTVLSVQTGLPISNAAVQLFKSESTIPIANAITNQDGSFIVIGLEPGEYSVVAQATAFGSVAVGAIVIPNDTTEVTIELPPLPGSISGRVTDFGGNGIPNATVRLIDQNQNVVGIGATDLNGNYTIANIAPGTYTIISSAPNFGTNTIGVTLEAAQVLTGINVALQANPGTIAGQVTNSAGGTPIAGATVTVRSISAGNTVVQTVNTDQTGNYIAPSLSPGQYSVTVAKTGFGTQTQSVAVTSNQTTTANFALLLDTGNISGTVTNTSGDPITGSNIFIRVFNENGLLVKSVTAESNGTFEVLDLEPGSYSLVADAPNYAANTLMVIVQANETTTVAIPLTENPAAIIGQVLSEATNTPIQGALITASINGQIISTTVSDINGNFQLTNLPSGTVDVTVSAPNFETFTQVVNLIPGETDQITASLESLFGSITGTIIDQQTGEPIVGATVTIRQFSPSGPIVQTVITNALGAFAVLDLPPSTYTAVAQAPNFGTQSATTVVLSNTVSTVTIGLSASPGAVEGTVRSGSVPVAGATVRVIRQDGTLIEEVTTNASGFYSVEGLPADSYTVVVTDPGFQQQSVGFTVVPNQTTTVDVNLLLNPGSLTGVVTDLFTAGPIANAIILVFQSQSTTPVAQAISDINGQYTVLGLAPGEYNVVASATNYARRGVGAVITAGEQTVASIQLTPNPAVVSGIITGAGTPLSNATVRVFDQNETLLGTAITDENGNYSISNLPQGTLTVIVSAPDFARNLTAVTVSAGQVLLNVNVDLNPLFGNVTGRIFNDDTGEAIVGAIAVIRAVGGTSVIVASDTTDSEGNYIIEGLAPGSYSIIGTATGFATLTVGAVVQADITTVVDLGLSPVVGTINGTVTDLSGNVITGTNIQVQVFNSNGAFIKTLLANSNGTFTVFNLAPGAYFIQAAAPNFGTTVASATVNANEVTSITLALTPNPATVNGQIINAETLEPLSGVIVTVTDRNGLIIGNAVSDINGRFTIQNLPPTNVTLTATATSPGFGSASTSVQLGPGAVNTVTLALPPQAGLLTGTVRNAQTGVVISGATIQVFDFTRALIATVVTSQDGQYLITNLSPGLYRVIASAQNVGSVAQEIEIVENETSILDYALNPNPGLIQGTVINQQTNQPLGGVSIVVRQFSPTGPIVASSSTTGDGTFTLASLAPGFYTVIASLASFGTQAASVTVNANETTVVQLGLTPNPGNVQGTITSAETGEPLANTLVRAINNNGVIIGVVQTNLNGQYSIQGLTPGTYTLIVINADFQRETVGLVISSGQTITINIALEPNSGSITGTIISSQTGVPLVGAAVQLYPSQGLIPIANGVTDQTGRYNFIGIAPGTYTVVANAPNFIRASVGTIVISNEQSVANLALDPNPAQISGTIVDGNGIPIPNVTVRIIDESETVLGTGVSSGNGVYAIDGLPPGTNRAIITAVGFSTGTGSITLAPGEIRNNVNFVLAANPGTLSGEVINSSDNSPLIGAVVVLRNQAGAIIASTFTNVDGRYTIPSLAPSQYSVTFLKNGFGTVVLGAQVISGTTTILNAAISPLSGGILGRMINEQGNPITGQNLQVKIYNERLVLIQTILAHEDGTFNVGNLEPGTYFVNVTAPGFAANTVSALVNENEDTEVVVTLISLPATLTGQVEDSTTGASISGASITVVRPNGVILATGVSGEDGRFTISNLPAGSFLVIAQAQGFGMVTTSIILTAGEVTSTALLLTPSTGTLSGQVTNEVTNAPIAGAAIQIFDQKRTLIGTVLTNSEGNFVVPNLAPGQYTAIISAQNFGSQLRGFVITSNEVTIIAVALSQNPGIIQGQITDEATGQPIASASIVIRTLSPAGPIIATTVSDQNGFYQVTGLASGIYTVVISSAPIYGSEAVSVSVDSGETRIVNISLALSQSALQGRITDESGAGVENALVQLFNEQGVLIRRIQADSEGNYLLTGFAPGNYVISVTEQNYQSISLSVRTLPGETVIVNFTLTGNPGSISGAARNAGTNQPIPGSIVQIFTEQSFIPLAFAVTDQQGNYEFTGLRPGNYVVLGTAFNFSNASVGATVEANRAAVANLFLQPNPASITGSVTTNDGTPINNAVIRILDQNEIIRNFGITGSEGTYAIGNLPPGTFRIIIAAPGFQPVLSTISLTQGEQRENVNFILEGNPGSISGTVTDLDGNPVQGAAVTIRINGPAGVIVTTTFTDITGQYRADQLGSGSYTVTVSATGFNTQTAGAIVESGETTIVDVVLSTIFGSISGVVLNNLGQPFTGANNTVSLFDENGVLILTTNIQSNGRFAFPNIDPGAYVVRASAEGFITGEAGVNVVEGEDSFVTLLLQPNPARVIGRVINSSIGDGILGSIVSATTMEGRVLTVTTTDEQGNFTLTNLPPGSIIITANASLFGSDSRAVLLQSNATANVTLSLSPTPGFLRGVVTNDEGEPISGVSVQVFDITNGLVATVLTNQLGRYQVDGLDPGTYIVVFNASQYQRLTAGATIISGEITPLNVQLIGLFANINGVVLNAETRAPLTGAVVILRYQSPSGPIFATVATDFLGRFEFTGVPEGEVSISATAEGFGREAFSATVFPGQTITFEFLLLAQTGIIQGIVTNADTGARLINTRISILNNLGIVVATTQTDGDGNYVVPNLAPGMYQVVALNVNFQAQSQSTTVQSNQAAIVNFALIGSPSSLRGQIIDADTGFPIIGALIEVLDGEGRQIAFGVTDQEGNYVIDGIPEGAFAVRINAPSYLTASETVRFTADETEILNVELSRTQTDSGVIAGRVFDALTNAPISNARVDLVNSEGRLVDFTFTTGNGQYFFQGLSPDTYTVFVTAEGYEEAQRTVILPLGESRFEVDFPLNRSIPLGAISGRVLNAENSQPIIGALIEILNAQGQVVASVRTDANGSFTIDLQPGLYTVRVSATGFITETQLVTVEGEQTTVVDIFLVPRQPVPPLGAIRGTVLSAKDCKPIHCALVEIINMTGNVVSTVRTDANGRFFVTELQPGLYTVRVSALGFISETAEVTVAEGQVSTVQILLRSEPVPTINPCDILNPAVTCQINKVTCREMDSSKRRDVPVVLTDGSLVKLQVVQLSIKITLTIKIKGTYSSCESEPFDVYVQDSVVLCAPSKANILCKTTVTNCDAELLCSENQQLEGVCLSLEVAQNITSEEDVMIEVKGLPISQRSEVIEEIANKNGDNGHIDYCLKVPKVVDWVTTFTHREFKLVQGQVDFRCIE